MVFEHLRPRATQTAYSESDTALYNTSYRDYTTTATILTVQSGGVARTRTRVSLALSPPGRLLLPLGWRRCGTRVGSLLRARTSHGRKKPTGGTDEREERRACKTDATAHGWLIDSSSVHTPDQGLYLTAVSVVPLLYASSRHLGQNLSSHLDVTPSACASFSACIGRVLRVCGQTNKTRLNPSSS